MVKHSVKRVEGRRCGANTNVFSNLNDLQRFGSKDVLACRRLVLRKIDVRNNWRWWLLLNNRLPPQLKKNHKSQLLFHIGIFFYKSNEDSFYHFIFLGASFLLALQLIMDILGELQPLHTNSFVWGKLMVLFMQHLLNKNIQSCTTCTTSLQKCWTYLQ